MLTKSQIIPLVGIIINVLSALGYIGINTRMSIYWIAVAVIGITVTF